MPPFQYRSESNPYAQSVGALLAQRGDIEAQRAQQVANAQAQAAQARGQAWGGAVQSVGQILGGIPQQMQQQKQADADRAYQTEVRGQQLAAGKASADERGRVAQERSVFDAALKDATVTNPETGLMTYDRQKAQQIVVGANMGHLWPQISEILDASDAADTAMSKAHEAAIMQSVKLVDAAGNDPSFFLHELERGIANKRYTKEEAAPFLELAQQGAEAIAKTTAALLGKKPDLMAVNPGDSVIDKNNPGAGPAFTALQKPDVQRPPIELNEGSILVDPATGKVIARGNPRREPGTTNGDPGPLETIIGPDGKAMRVARKDAVGHAPAAGTEKASSGVQKRVLNFFNRAQQADVDLEALEPEIEKLGLAGQVRQSWAPNFAQTQLGQSYTAAQRAFTEARLRKDSGAAIPPHEFENDRRTYFVQPGDSKKTIQDKNRARAAMLASLGFESGQALGEFLGDADEAKRVVDGYKTRAARKDSGAITVTAPDGSKHDFATQAEADRFKQLAGMK